jgi:hypothetical protein
MRCHAFNGRLILNASLIDQYILVISCLSYSRLEHMAEASKSSKPLRRVILILRTLQTHQELGSIRERVNHSSGNHVTYQKVTVSQSIGICMTVLYRAQRPFTSSGPVTVSSSYTSISHAYTRHPGLSSIVQHLDIMAQQILPRIPNVKFRVLIIGRANAGKTSILQRVVDTTESPEIYRLDKSGNQTLVRSPSCSSFHLIVLPG